MKGYRQRAVLSGIVGLSALGVAVASLVAGFSLGEVALYSIGFNLPPLTLCVLGWGDATKVDRIEAVA